MVLNEPCLDSYSFAAATMSSNSMEVLHRFQRRKSVVQKDINRYDTERCTWAGPPLDVSFNPFFFIVFIVFIHSDILE